MDFSEKMLALALGFLITTIIGGLLGYQLNRRSWQLQTTHEIYRARVEEGTRFLDEISVLIGKRFFALQRLFWTLRDGSADLLPERERDYFAVVTEWNAQFWRNRNKIRLLVGEELADRFLNYGDDAAVDQPMSLHYQFVWAHRKVMEAKSNRDLMTPAGREVDRLNAQCSAFLEQLTADFLTRAASLQLLKLPTPRKAEPRIGEQPTTP